jgi:hypothetical protein
MKEGYLNIQDGGGGDIYIILITKEHYDLLTTQWEEKHNFDIKIPKEIKEQSVFFGTQPVVWQEWPFNDVKILGTIHTY